MTWYNSVWLLSLMFCAIAYNLSYQDPQQTYLIDTASCKIQNFTMKYTKMQFNYNICGTRHIFLKTLPDNQIKFHLTNDFYNSCVYRFIDLKQTSKEISLNVRNPIWMPFSNGTTAYLKSEFIKVQCYPTEKGGYQIYDDVYAKIKKLNKSKLSSNNQTRVQDDKLSWNVLMIGMDSMSRARAFDDLPNTVSYLKKQGWVDFKGYNMGSSPFSYSQYQNITYKYFPCLQGEFNPFTDSHTWSIALFIVIASTGGSVRVSHSSFSNLMSVLTNKNLSTLSRTCQPSISSCNENFIWSRFKEAGYITAFGEDCSNRSYIESTQNAMAFGNEVPTDHYLRSVFIDGETKIGPNFCTKTMLSAKHVFSYAFEFVNTYKKDKFFGFFRIRSLSHDSDQSPTSFDVPLTAFFKKLKDVGILSNTFVIFFSDHGLQHINRENDVVAAYYEKRLPMLFMKIPNKFKRINSERYARIYAQQSRLISPFDLHLTIWGIAVNFERLYPLPSHEGCPKCDSLFEVIAPDRTCADAGIIDALCTCHDLRPFLKRQDYGLQYSLNIVMLRLYNITKDIQTVSSTRCQEFRLSKLLSIRKYLEMPKMFYFIIGTLWPDQTVFQAKVAKRIIHESLLNTSYSRFEYQIESLQLKARTRLQCTINETERIWCVCEKIKPS